MPDATETLITDLRAWARTHDAHVRAAVDLLAWHEHWLRRASFVAACVVRHGGTRVIDWREAREFSDSAPRGSTSELAVLDLAVALGENRFRLNSMGAQHRQAIADAVRKAVGL